MLSLLSSTGHHFSGLGAFLTKYKNALIGLVCSLVALRMDGPISALCFINPMLHLFTCRRSSPQEAFVRLLAPPALAPLPPPSLPSWLHYGHVPGVWSSPLHLDFCPQAAQPVRMISFLIFLTSCQSFPRLPQLSWCPTYRRHPAFS